MLLLLLLLLLSLLLFCDIWDYVVRLDDILINCLNCPNVYTSERSSNTTQLNVLKNS